MSKTVLCVAAHPDDEVLGCGGTMARHVLAGDTVHVVILAEGVTSRDQMRDRSAREEELSDLARSATRANQILGVKSLNMSCFPDNRLDSVALLEIVKSVEDYLTRLAPDVVYTHHCGDVNIDHRRIHDAVVTACRPMPGNQQVRTLLFFEVPSSTEWQPPASAAPFTPDWYVDITECLPTKQRALEAYASEMRPWPHARSVEAVAHLAHWRGANIGVQAAEAFMLGRRIVI